MHRLTHMTWLLAPLGYILANGLLGVTTKVALRRNSWADLLLWAAIVYAILAVVLYFVAGARLHVDGSAWVAIVSGMLAASGLVLYYIGIRGGDVSRVVPIMSVYPVVTLIGAAFVLSEPITAGTIGGVALILGGLVVLAR